MKTANKQCDPHAIHSHVRLNMIVRNEVEVILGALDSVLGVLDSFAILDTGSTDDTIERIVAWSEQNAVPGRVYSWPWKDFGTNRTKALEHAVEDGIPTHLLFLDADDRFEQLGSPEIVPGISYQIEQQNGSTRYLLPNLIDVTRSRWVWREPLHEYLVAIEGNPVYQRAAWLRTIKNSVRGARSKGVSQTEKYRRDADVLRARLEEDPDNTRAMFYFANSLRDACDDAQAIEAYRQRIHAGGWDQETYSANIDAALCAERLGNRDEALGIMFGAWNFRPARRDAPYHIVRMLRQDARFAAGWHLAEMARSLPPETDDVLFVNKDAYGFRMIDEASICAFYLGHFGQSFELSCEALEMIGPDHPDAGRITKNAEFAQDKLLERACQPAPVLRQAYAASLRGKSQQNGITVTITSAMRSQLFRRTVDSFLYCCLDKDLIDRWICVDDGTDDTEFKALKSEFPFFEWYRCEDKGGKGHARSMNFLLDMVQTPYWLHLEDDWDFFLPANYIERSIDLLDHRSDLSQVLFNRNYAQDLAEIHLLGGAPRETDTGTRYWDHEHLSPPSPEYDAFFAGKPANALSNVWWPHFSLRPSVMRLADMRRIGPFNEAVDQFEIDHAHRFIAEGCKSAFLFRLCSLHSGKKVGTGTSFEKNAFQLLGNCQSN